MLALLLIAASLFGPFEAYPYRLQGRTPGHCGYGVNVYGEDCMASGFVDGWGRGWVSVRFSKSSWGITWR